MRWTFSALSMMWLELFEELYELQNNQPMSDMQRDFALELIESIWEGRV